MLSLLSLLSGLLVVVVVLAALAFHGFDIFLSSGEAILSSRELSVSLAVLVALGLLSSSLISPLLLIGSLAGLLLCEFLGTSLGISGRLLSHLDLSLSLGLLALSLHLHVSGESSTLTLLKLVHADLESGINFLLELGLLSLLSCLGFLLLRLKLFDGSTNTLLVLLRALHDLLSINSFVAQSLVKLLQIADLTSDRLGSFVLLVLVALLGLLHHASIKLVVLNGTLEPFHSALGAIIDIVGRFIIGCGFFGGLFVFCCPL